MISSLPRSSPSLPRLLSLLPKNGLNSVIYQKRWTEKGIPTPSTAAIASLPLSSLSSASHLGDTCYWNVKKVNLSHTPEGKLKAKAYGVLMWRGKRVTDAGKEYEKIKGGLKYDWACTSTPPLLVPSASPKSKSVQSSEPSTSS